MKCNWCKCETEEIYGVAETEDGEPIGGQYVGQLDYELCEDCYLKWCDEHPELNDDEPITKDGEHA